MPPKKSSVPLKQIDGDALAWHVYKFVFPAAFALLPGQMDTPQARAQLVAIGFQESEFIARQQGGTKGREGQGPAKSFWQFERAGGVAELIDSPVTRPYLAQVCIALGYLSLTPASLHEAMEHNDTLACVMARLLLWKDPRTMPESTQPEKGWTIYLERWRPGKPHPDRWPANFERAWSVIRA